MRHAKEWAEHVNSTDIVEKWSKLGFVKPIERDNVTLFVEKERGKIQPD